MHGLLPPEPTLNSEEKVALDKILNGELPPAIVPVDIPEPVSLVTDEQVAALCDVLAQPDGPGAVAELEKLPYPSIARRWGLGRLTELATDRGLAVPEGADKDAVMDLLYPDAE